MPSIWEIEYLPFNLCTHTLTQNLGQALEKNTPAQIPSDKRANLPAYFIGATLMMMLLAPVVIGLGWRLYQQNARTEGLKQVISIRLDTIINEKEKAFVEQTKNIDLNDKTQASLALEQIKTIRNAIEQQLDEWQDNCQCVLLNPRGVYRQREHLDDQTQAFMDELNQRLKIIPNTTGESHVK